jgi:hypothetical protein
VFLLGDAGYEDGRMAGVFLNTGRSNCPVLNLLLSQLKIGMDPLNKLRVQHSVLRSLMVQMYARALAHSPTELATLRHQFLDAATEAEITSPTVQLEPPEEVHALCIEEVTAFFSEVEEAVTRIAEAALLSSK